MLSSVLFAEIDERKSDFYYGNGIMTTEIEARDALKDVIKPTVLTEIYNSDQTEMDKYHHFDLAYNYSAEEKFGDTPVAMILDLLESYEQMTDTSLGWWTADTLKSLALGRMNIVKTWTSKRFSNHLIAEGFPPFMASFLADKIVGASKHHEYQKAS